MAGTWENVCNLSEGGGQTHRVGHTQTISLSTHTELGRNPGPGGFSGGHLGAEIFIVLLCVPSTFCNTPCCSFHRSWTLSGSIRGAPPQGADSTAHGRPGGREGGCRPSLEQLWSRKELPTQRNGPREQAAVSGEGPHGLCTEARIEGRELQAPSVSSHLEIPVTSAATCLLSVYSEHTPAPGVIITATAQCLQRGLRML